MQNLRRISILLLMFFSTCLAQASGHATGGIKLNEKAGETLKTVVARGELLCGVNHNMPGFSVQREDGVWHGMGVDYCKAMAAAIFGDASKVKFVDLSVEGRFDALKSKKVDILSGNNTFNISRDLQMDLTFSGIMFYDGQSFLVKKRSNINKVKDLNKANICMLGNTTSIENVDDYFAVHGMTYKSVMFDDSESLLKAFQAGSCVAYASDKSNLAAKRITYLQYPEEYKVLDETISKEPLGPVVRDGDDNWNDIARWVLFALIEAEEKGINKANVLKQAATSPDYDVQRLLGARDDFGSAMSLNKTWALDAIAAVGNYAEVYSNNLGAGSRLNLARGNNVLWSKGGLLISPPIR